MPVEVPELRMTLSRVKPISETFMTAKGTGDFRPVNQRQRESQASEQARREGYENQGSGVGSIKVGAGREASEGAGREKEMKTRDQKLEEQDK